MKVLHKTFGWEESFSQRSVLYTPIVGMSILPFLHIFSSLLCYCKDGIQRVFYKCFKKDVFYVQFAVHYYNCFHIHIMVFIYGTIHICYIILYTFTNNLGYFNDDAPFFFYQFSNLFLLDILIVQREAK